MELLLTANVNVPTVGKGVVVGVPVANGKYLIEGFIQTPDGDDGNLEEHIYGHCLEVHYRLMGGVSLLGVWSTFDEDSVSIKVFKRLRKAEIITTDFVSILFYDDKTSKAKRIRESGDVQKVDVKTTSHLKWPTCVASANFSIISQIATENLYSEDVGSALIKLVKQQLQHIDVSINDKFGSFEELIFPKTLKSLPPTLPMKIYIGCKDDPPSTMSTKLITLHLNIAVFCLLTAKSTYRTMLESIRSDTEKSISKRIDIVLDELTLDLENEPNEATLISTSQLPRRVMYPLEGTGLISLYGTDQTTPADELDYIFSTPESSKLFQYPEEEISDVEDDDDMVVENIPTKEAQNNSYIYALIVMIIAVLVSIILSQT